MNDALRTSFERLDPSLPETGCPKAMTFGPCGGVRPNSSCEVDARRCPFTDHAAPPWPAAPHTPRPVDLPRCIVDLRPDLDANDFVSSIEALAHVGAAGLLGDHVDDPAVPTVAQQAAAVIEIGVPVIATVACRGRTLHDARQAISDLVEADVAAVLCVTGDHPSVRTTGHARFDLDGPRLSEVARDVGAHVAVASSPATPPNDLRADRLRLKQDAGADLAILNHAGDIDALERFATASHELGATLALAAPVPIICDRTSHDALTQFPGLRLPTIFTAPGERSIDAGVERAVDWAVELLQSGLFDHLNLSGRATRGGQGERAAVMAEVVRQISARTG